MFIAPYDVLLGENDIVEPDLIYVSKQRASIVTELHIRGIPDLLVEVVSPLRPEYDRDRKRLRYSASGVPWYWIVDPLQKSLTELQLAAGDYVVASEAAGEGEFNSKLLPELVIDLERLLK